MILKLLNYCLITVTVFVAAFAFGRNSQSLKSDSSDIIGKKLNFPKNASWVISGRDTTVLLTNKPKIVVHFSNSGCTACSLKELKHWKKLIAESKAQDNFEFVFIVSTQKSNEAVQRVILSEKFDFPILFDEYYEFISNNTLSDKVMLHTYLIDSSNIIKLVGNPLLGKKQWSKFQEEILKCKTDN